MQRTLSEWLDYQQSTHPQAMALGLQRVHELAARLAIGRVARRVILVAGTNGKGSTVAFIDAMARAAGLRVGCYTSPHLLRYNERVRVDGEDASDVELIAAFERIEAVRGAVQLTFFEWGTLAALLLFAAARLDLAVLEVGLGGRLDAVNIVDADVAVITTVDLDHMELLGDTREDIGREKVGILRAHRVAVLGEAEPPASVLAHAELLGATVLRNSHDFAALPGPHGHWRYAASGVTYTLPVPAMQAPCQIGNAATAITALRAAVDVGEPAIAAGVASARVAGRLQRVPGAVELILDVAHNPQSARQLADWLHLNPPAGSDLTVFAALRDKDVEGLVEPLVGSFSAWHLGAIADAGARSQTAEQLAQRLQQRLPLANLHCHGSVATALQAARAMAVAGDRIVVFGSFHTVGAALAELPTG